MAKTASSRLALATVGALLGASAASFAACGGGETSTTAAEDTKKKDKDDEGKGDPGKGDDDVAGDDTSGSDDAMTPSAPPDASTSATCGGCTGYAPMAPVATFAYSDMEELSGLVASRKHPNVFYTHNDSGDSARFFAVNASGVKLGEFELAGVDAKDWEDVAIGPCCAPGSGACGDKTCLFFADIGDNDEKRTDLVIYRVEEPTDPAAAQKTQLPFDALRIKYPDGKHNSEAFVVHPKTGDGYVIVKTGKPPIGVYKLPAGASTTAETTMTAAGALNVPDEALVKLVTAADLHPCEDRLLVRTYTAVYEYKPLAGQPFESAFGANPTSLGTPAELQGEAIAYRADGRGYFTVPEDTKNPPKLSFGACK